MSYSFLQAGAAFALRQSTTALRDGGLVVDDLDAIAGALAKLPPLEPLTDGSDTEAMWARQEALAGAGTWLVALARCEASWRDVSVPLRTEAILDETARRYHSDALATIRVPVSTWAMATRLQSMTSTHRQPSANHPPLPEITFDCVHFEDRVGPALSTLQCQLVRTALHLAFHGAQPGDLFEALAKSGDWITPDALRQTPTLTDLLVLLDQAVTAVRQQAGEADEVALALAASCTLAWSRCREVLVEDRGICVTPAQEATICSGRVQFEGEPERPDEPQIELVGRERLLLRRASVTHRLPAPRAAWTALKAFERGAGEAERTRLQSWRPHVRRGLEALALREIDAVPLEQASTALAHAAKKTADLMQHLSAARRAAVRAFVLEHLSVRLLPDADVIRRADGAAIDWTRSVVESSTCVRGTVLSIDRFGAQIEGAVVQTAQVTLSAGRDDRIALCRTAWEATSRTAPWVAPAAILATQSWDELREAHGSGGPAFFEVDERIRAEAQQQVRLLEDHLRADVSRAIEVAALHRLLLELAAPGRWRELAESEVAPCSHTHSVRTDPSAKSSVYCAARATHASFAVPAPTKEPPARSSARSSGLDPGSERMRAQTNTRGSKRASSSRSSRPGHPASGRFAISSFGRRGSWSSFSRPRARTVR